jgi:glycerol-3-phosphate acyltransferase PlsY
MQFYLGLWILFAYLSGSLCSAIVVCRLCGLSDPRSSGSNNPGATNVLRLHGKSYAALVLLGDILKATLPLLIAHVCGLALSVQAWMGLFAVLGHIFPIFFRFKGGKGVATALGVYFGLSWSLGLMVLGLWILIAYFKRYSSLASLISMSLAPIFSYLWTHDILTCLPLGLISLLVIWMHYANILRLLAGQESKLKF